LDDTVEKQMRIEHLLNKISQEKKARKPSDGDPDS